MEVLDGVQRLRALANFLSDHLHLTKLDKLSECDSLTFRQLPVAYQDALKNRLINVIILSDITDEQARNIHEMMSHGASKIGKDELERLKSLH